MKTINPEPQQSYRASNHRAQPETSRSLAALMLVLAAVSTAGAQSFSINWFKVAGGGGVSTAGSSSLSGTIGQPDASGLLTGGQFSVRGGFWTLPVAVQVIGSPVLTIAPAGPGLAILSWSPATPGFVLQETTSLISPIWTDAPSGSANPATVTALAPAKFYRLIKR